MQASWRNTSAEATYTVASVLLSTALVLPYRSSIATIAVPLKGTHTVGFGMISIVSIYRQYIQYYIKEATKAIAFMPPGHCLGALEMLW